MSLPDSIASFHQKLQQLPKDFVALYQDDHHSYIEQEQLQSPQSQTTLYKIDKGPIEKGAILITKMQGLNLPKSASDIRSWTAQSFCVAGLSVIFHARHPLAPTIHGNIRKFSVQTTQGEKVWYGGGIDLTPYHPDTQLALKWHRGIEQIIEPIQKYIPYKKAQQHCDEYFYLNHRDEPRGVGGVFFDDIEVPKEQELFFEEHLQALILYLGRFYSESLSYYKDRPHNEEDRSFQEMRRGRYVEFNLLYDRGTKFGLDSRGRADSILLSLPPAVSWPLMSDMLLKRNSELVLFFNKIRNSLSSEILAEQEI